MSDMKMSLDEKKAEFLSFCIENYKKKLGTPSSVKITEYFDDYGVLDFLLENYDLLHTLGCSQLIDEIERFLKKEVHNEAVSRQSC